MTETYRQMIEAMANSQAEAQRAHRLAETLYPRGTRIEWRSGTGWDAGIVIAQGWGRRLFVASFRTGHAIWIGLYGLKSLIDPAGDVSADIYSLRPEGE